MNKIPSPEEVTGQRELSSDLVEASVEAAKCLDVLFIFLHGYDFGEVSIFEMVHYAVGSFEPCDI